MQRIVEARTSSSSSVIGVEEEAESAESEADGWVDLTSASSSAGVRVSLCWVKVSVACTVGASRRAKWCALYSASASSRARGEEEGGGGSSAAA